MRRLIYFIGEPGVGKSTLMAMLAAGHVPHQMEAPIPHIVYDDGGVAQLGRLRGEFSGTDALGMSVQPRVEEWLAQRPYRVIFAEGDRLANSKFFRAAEDGGYELAIVVVEADDVVLEQRRASRAFVQRRQQQDVRWLRGRRTKIRNLVSEWPTVAVRNDLFPAHSLGELRSIGLDPFEQVQP